MKSQHKCKSSVSVIMPIGRWDDFVLRAINSVLLQGDIVGELLLIDNAISKPTPNQIRVIKSSKKIKIVESEYKMNAARARNIGILNSRFKFIAVLDSDDEYLENHLNIAVQELIQNNSDFYCCSYINKLSEGIQEIRKPEKNLTSESLIRRSTIGHSTVVYKKHLSFKYPEIGRRHDYAAWLLLFSGDLKYSTNDEALVIRHKTKGSLSSTKLGRLFLKQIIVTYKFSPFNFLKTSCLFAEF